MPDKLTEAKSLTIFFGKKYAGKTLGEVCLLKEGDSPRGLMWIHWVATLNAVNGPQPKDDRIKFHRACQIIAEHYEREISAGIEMADNRKRAHGKPVYPRKPIPGHTKHHINDVEVFDV